MKRISSQVLFDECAIPVGYSSWRRPKADELIKTLEHDKNNLLYKESMNFANELKLMCIFAIEAYVDPYWLLNNPKLMFLSNLSRKHPNWIGPAFSNEFFIVYWGKRQPYKYESLFIDTYPEKGEPNLPPNSSYIDDIYYTEKEFFERSLRLPLTNYITTCLSQADTRRDLDRQLDPPSMMKKYLLEVGNNPSHHIPFGMKETAAIEDLLRKTTEYFVEKDLRFSMTAARDKWRKLAKNKYSDCLTETNQRIIDWIFRNSVYLRAHSDVTNGIPTGYSETSTDVDTLQRVNQGTIIDKKGEKKLEILGMDWHIYSDYFGYFSTYLSELSFETIFEIIRKAPFYEKYKVKMKEIRGNTDDDVIVRETINAYNYLIGNIIPILRDEISDPIFKEKVPWNILGWYISNNNMLSIVIGSVATMATAGAVTLSIPIAIFAGLVSGGVIALPSNVEKLDIWLKGRRGRRMFMVVAKARQK